MSQDLHIVYGIVPSGDPSEPAEKVRVSRPQAWGDAIARWQTLTPNALSYPAEFVTLCVRSADDPNWPASGPCHLTRDIKTGRFV